MALLDFFKKKKKPRKEEKKVVEKKKEVKEVKKPKKEVLGISYKVLHSPHVTEKATVLTEGDKYVFKVLPRTNKVEIKQAIQDVYGVHVTKVRIINVPKRQRRIGRQTGWRKGYKKAIVSLRKGEKIEILPR